MDKSVIKNIKLFLFDMDGTLYLGDNLYEFTVPLLNEIRKGGANYLFMTNNSSKSVADYIKKLEKHSVLGHIYLLFFVIGLVFSSFVFRH